MSDTASPEADAFASVASDDIRPGETAAQARSRRKTAANRAKRAAAAAAKSPAAPAGEPTPPAPPAPKARAETPPARPVGRPSVKSRRADKTRGVIGIVGVAVRPFNVADSDAILNGADALADSLAELAETNKTVAKVLDSISGTSAWAAVALAVYGIAAPIAVNHGVFGLGQPAKPAPAAEPEHYVAPAPGAPDFDPANIRFSVADGVRV